MNAASQQTDTDVIIVGGGAIGLIQALSLAHYDIMTTIIDRDDPTQRADARTTAISYGSHQLLTALGLWDELRPHACPIHDIQVLEGRSPVLLDFNINNDQTNADAFGWVIENHIVRRVLHDAINAQKNITHINGQSVSNFARDNNQIIITLENGKTLNAPLVIGADGRQSITREWMDVGTREWSYKQQAIVTIVTHEKPHNNIAVEHFKSEGPFAILPMLDDDTGAHRSSIVWTQEMQTKNNPLTYTDETFKVALNSQFPSFYGDILSFTKRLSYPLNYVHANGYIAANVVLIGDAAHGIHPIAGQGLNLGLRDIAALTDIITQAKNNNEEIGDLKTLEKYQRARRSDNIAMAVTTDILNKVFSNNILPIRLSRKIGLKLISKFKPSKDFFIKQAMGTSGHLPDTIRHGKFKK